MGIARASADREDPRSGRALHPSYTTRRRSISNIVSDRRRDDPLRTGMIQPQLPGRPLKARLYDP
jgi:hypothetical protein